MQTQSVTKFNKESSGYANFTLYVAYKHEYAKKIGRNTQVHRGDVTRLKFENERIDVTGWHDLAILWKKLCSLTHCVHSARLYDNTIAGSAEQRTIGKYTIVNGAIDATRDNRYQYYDIQTGKAR